MKKVKNFKLIVFMVFAFLLKACSNSGDMSSTPGASVNQQDDENAKRLLYGSSHLEFIDLPESELLNNDSHCKGILVPMLYIKLPAYRDGLRPGDVIMTIDGQCFARAQEFLDYIGNKQDTAITIKFKKSGGAITTAQTSLITTEKYNGIVNEFINTATTEDGDILYFNAEESTKYIDRGDAYEYFKLEDAFKRTHWDFMEYRNLNAVTNYAEEISKPILIALFGSKNCCSYMSMAQKTYEGLIADIKIQAYIKNHFVSVLVLKPEAYQVYEDYNIDSNQPAILVIDSNSRLRKSFHLNEETDENKLFEFLGSIIKS